MMRADSVREGYVAPNGSKVTAASTVYGDGPDDGVTTIWWDNHLITYTSPDHQMEEPPSGSTREANDG